MGFQPTYTAFDERDLITAAKHGDCAAFKTIYENHRDGVYNLISYSLNDSRMIEDVLQIVFMKIYRGLPGFRFEASLSTWVYRVAINECQNQNRLRKTRLVPLDTIAGSGEEIDTDSIPENMHSHRERQEIVQQAVMELSPKLRVVVVLKYVDGLSYEEIAEVLKLPAGTVASRLNRALEGLESRLRPFRPIL